MFTCCCAAEEETYQSIPIPTGKIGGDVPDQSTNDLLNSAQPDNPPKTAEPPPPPPKVEPVPAAPPPPDPALNSEFWATVEKPVGAQLGQLEPLGLELDLLDGKHAQVRYITAGAIQVYNDKATSERQIKTGDYICQVNELTANGAPKEVKGDAEAICQCLENTAGTLEMLIRRSTEFSIQVKKQAGSIGMDLNYAERGTSLVVLKVNAGPVLEYNTGKGPEQQVSSGDRITEVNGVRGVANKLVTQLKATDDLKLTFARPRIDKPA